MKAPACYFFIALRFFFGGGDLTEAAVQSKFDYIIIPEKRQRNQTKEKEQEQRGPRGFSTVSWSFLVWGKYSP